MADASPEAPETAVPELEIEGLLLAERSRVRARLLALTRNAAEAEDLTQETLVRAWRARDQLRDPAALRGWLSRIATNVAAEWARGEGRRAARVSAAAAREPRGCGDDPAFLDLERREMSSCVQDLARGLTEAQRAVVLMHDGLGLTNQQVADSLGCSLAAVKIRLHRGRARLASLVDESCTTGADQRGVVVCEPR